MAVDKRQLVLETALKLFSENGFHATGIDKVQAESKVSKTTMYKYFKSKDDLILEVLKFRDEQFDAWISERIDFHCENTFADEPVAKLFALFEALHEWFNCPNFCGCNFINACAEFNDQNHPVHKLSTEHKLNFAGFIKDVLDESGFKAEEDFALQICILIEGAIVFAHTACQKQSAKVGQKMLRVLLENQRQSA
ncbi:TetR/AcrR family transcriptional regulator [Litoribacillus peritrichatus]|uniref:TetR family transcriptional regulator n=1 Tax=Litoribacillus peritrichatus TaxID=718191 RepID=A0ABP7N487_9GAMM